MIKVINVTKVNYRMHLFNNLLLYSPFFQFMFYYKEIIEKNKNN